jgi:hypothetical protein
VPWGKNGDKTGKSQSPLSLPAHNDHQPLLACPVAKMVT